MFDNLIDSASRRYGVPGSIIRAIIDKESSFNPNARGGASEYGLMQLVCTTANFMGFSGDCKQLLDPATNIEYGTKYLQYQFNRYGKWTDAIAAYNAGSVFKNSGGQYTNTKGVANVEQYVLAVLSRLKKYDWILASDLEAVKKKSA